jgi:Cu2+-exporting ATPase
VSKTVGSEVIAGSINGDGSLKVKVAKIGEHTFLAGVMRLVAEAEASKSRLQILSDRAAFYLTIIAIAAGGLTFVLWLLSQAGIAFATERLVAVLVIACPHALGLAVPLVASISTTMAARNGLLIKQRLSLEAARTVGVVLFDKTGTLTKGEFGVDTIVPAEGFTESDVLGLAASVNSQSEHPLAKSIVDDAKARKISLRPISIFMRLPGKGAKALVDGKEVLVGSEQLISDTGIQIPKNYREKITELERQGKTTIHVVSDKQLVGSIALADIIRSESREAIQSLKVLGIKIAMITGDSEDVAAWVSRELGVDQYFARVLPGQKADKVKLLQKDGRKVAMVGDGVNDAPALAAADLGIAIGAGTNVAIESAGIILVRNDPRDIPKIILLSKLTYAKMIQNLFWATGYNVIAIPLAAGVLASKGIILQPALAAIFMSLSTVIVAINAVLLRRRVL